MEPDISDPHDPYTEAPIYPEPGICSCDIPYDDRDYDSDHHTIYDIWKASGFVALPAAYFAYLLPCILLYMILATSLKKAYVRHFGELL